MKKILSLLLAFSLALNLAACGGSASSAASSTAVSEAASSAAASEEEAAAPLSATEPLHIAGLKGPTTMGLVNLLSMEQAGTAAMDYDLQLYGAADELVRHKVGVEPVGGIGNGRDCDASKHFLCHTVSPFALFKTYFAMCVSIFSAVSLPAATSLMAVVTGFSQRG